MIQLLVSIAGMFTLLDIFGKISTKIFCTKEEIESKSKKSAIAFCAGAFVWLAIYAVYTFTA